MSRARSALHLFALSAFAVAQPLFAKLGPAPGWFAAHHLSDAEIVAFVLVALLVPPLVLVALEALAGRVGRALHLVFIGGLVALIALPPLGSLPTALAALVAAAIGAAFAWAYSRRQGVQGFTTVLALATPLFLVVFLAGAMREDKWEAADSYRPPVVFIQFDALPSLLLETPDHKVDAVRYPNFARLSKDGAWYRNASNVHENTVFSVPSIVDGRIPRKGITPVVQDHNPNLFTLLGPGYRMNVAEEATSLCPLEFCRRPPAHPSLKTRVHQTWDDTRVLFNQIVRPHAARSSLPPIDDRWVGYDSGPLQTDFQRKKKTPEFVIRHLHSGRIARFDRWLAKVGSGGSQPELDYVHAFLPHEPREFLPDGRRYNTPDAALEGPPAYDKRFLNEQEQQRVQLQLGYTDGVVGRVIAKLKKLGIYDKALIVVVADHGESFDTKPTPAGPFVPGHLGYRRAVTPQNIADIASIPMFIKYPKGHGPTGIDDRYVRDIDIFPTIAKTIGLPLPKLDGTPLQEPGYNGHNEVAVGTTYDGTVRAGVKQWQAERQASLSRRLRLFGSGKDSLYAFGPHADLIGHPPPASLRPVRANVWQARALQNVNPESPVCLCQLAGRVARVKSGTPLAIAINGRIAATAEAFPGVGAKKLEWSAMVPPSAYRRGINTVRLYEIPRP